jgi:glutamate racemase
MAMQHDTTGSASHQKGPWIGIFDSGIGGLSVLRSVRRQRPDAPVHYVADSGHAPYGDRDQAHVVERSLRIANHLVRQGASLLIVACNTATAWAIEAMRQRHPELHIVGVEPGIKPAVQLSRNGIVGVLATPATLASPRFEALTARHGTGCDIVRIPCPGLASAIERGAQQEIDALLDQFCAPLAQSGADTVVLGCTHYPFVAEQIQSRLGPHVHLLDTADAVAKHALSQWQTLPPSGCDQGQIKLESTGNTAALDHLARQGLNLHVPATNIQL